MKVYCYTILCRVEGNSAFRYFIRYATARDSIPLRYRSRFHSLRYRSRFHSIPFHSIPFHSISFHFISFHFISFHFISFHFISFHFISFHFIGNVCIYTPYSPASSGLSPHSDCSEIAGLLMSCREYGIFVPFSKVSVYRVDDVFEQGRHRYVG